MTLPQLACLGDAARCVGIDTNACTDINACLDINGCPDINARADRHMNAGLSPDTITSLRVDTLAGFSADINPGLCIDISAGLHSDTNAGLHSDVSTSYNLDINPIVNARHSIHRNINVIDLPDRTVPCGQLERMPKWLICIPLACQWLWLACRFRSWTLPSAANPQITAGGLVGEGKMEYFNGMGPLAQAMTARSCAIINTAAFTDAQITDTLRDAGLVFPIIAKPDLGLCGYGVRRITCLSELRDYLMVFPLGEVIVLQAYLAHDGEAGIFYARDPQTDVATLIGLALRTYPSVCGDGRRSVAALIAADPRACRVLQPSRHQAPLNLTHIPAAGEVVRLSTIGSTRVGGLYRDGAVYMTPALTAAIDAIARQMPDFFCGRFDVRFESHQLLAAGRGFTIIEINGAGSEAIQAWDPQIGLIAGFKIIFAKQRRLFEIGAANRRRGAVPIGLVALLRLYRRQQRLIAMYPPSN